MLTFGLFTDSQSLILASAELKNAFLQGLIVNLSTILVQTEMSQQLLDKLPRNLLQTFMIPTGCILSSPDISSFATSRVTSVVLKKCLSSSTNLTLHSYNTVMMDSCDSGAYITLSGTRQSTLQSEIMLLCYTDP